MRLYCLLLDHPDAIAVSSPVVQRQVALICSNAGAVFFTAQPDWMSGQRGTGKPGN